MKLPFSYRHNFFKSVLWSSFIFHGVVFAQGNLFLPQPEFGIEQAPSSVEVMIIKEEIKEEQIEKNKVMTALDDSSELPEVAQKIEKKKEPVKPKIEKPVYIPPVRGAVTKEAKPAYLKNPAPLYPFLARQRGWEGLVLLRVEVETDGRPSQVKIKKSSGHSVLDEAALKTVGKWQFSPARIGTIKVASSVTVPIRFELDKAAA